MLLSRLSTTSTMMERSFSEMNAQYDKRKSRMLTETLCSLHNSNTACFNFLKALKDTCKAEQIKLD